MPVLLTTKKHFSVHVFSNKTKVLVTHLLYYLRLMLPPKVYRLLTTTLGKSDVTVAFKHLQSCVVQESQIKNLRWNLQSSRF